MNKAEAQIPVDSLFEMFDLDENTGKLTWKARPAHQFNATERRSADHACRNWNSRYAGTPALNCKTPFGHLTGRINNMLIYAHRVVFAMVNQRWPEGEIDHINGDPGDNNPKNLRDVSHKENLKNQTLRKNNSTGHNGVNRFKRDGNWVASIAVGGKTKHLGYFDKIENAILARKNAEVVYGYHKNHGRNTA